MSCPPALLFVVGFLPFHLQLQEELEAERQETSNNEQGWWAAYAEFREETEAYLSAKQEMNELSEALAKEQRGGGVSPPPLLSPEPASVARAPAREQQDAGVSPQSLLPPEPAPIASETALVLERAQLEIARLASLLQQQPGQPTGGPQANVVSTVPGGSSSSGTQNVVRPQATSSSSSAAVGSNMGNVAGSSGQGGNVVSTVHPRPAMPVDTGGGVRLDAPLPVGPPPLGTMPAAEGANQVVSTGDALPSAGTVPTYNIATPGVTPRPGHMRPDELIPSTHSDLVMNHPALAALPQEYGYGPSAAAGAAASVPSAPPPYPPPAGTMSQQGAGQAAAQGNPAPSTGRPVPIETDLGSGPSVQALPYSTPGTGTSAAQQSAASGSGQAGGVPAAAVITDYTKDFNNKIKNVDLPAFGLLKDASQYEEWFDDMSYQVYLATGSDIRVYTWLDETRIPDVSLTPSRDHWATLDAKLMVRVQKAIQQHADLAASIMHVVGSPFGLEP